MQSDVENSHELSTSHQMLVGPSYIDGPSHHAGSRICSLAIKPMARVPSGPSTNSAPPQPLPASHRSLFRQGFHRSETGR